MEPGQAAFYSRISGNVGVRIKGRSKEGTQKTEGQRRQFLDQDMKLHEMALKWGYRVQRGEHDFLVQSWYLKDLTAILDFALHNSKR